MRLGKKYAALFLKASLPFIGIYVLSLVTHEYFHVSIYVVNGYESRVVITEWRSSLLPLKAYALHALVNPTPEPTLRIASAFAAPLASATILLLILRKVNNRLMRFALLGNAIISLFYALIEGGYMIGTNYPGSPLVREVVPALLILGALEVNIVIIALSAHLAWTMVRRDEVLTQLSVKAGGFLSNVLKDLVRNINWVIILLLSCVIELVYLLTKPAMKALSDPSSVNNKLLIYRHYLNSHRDGILIPYSAIEVDFLKTMNEKTIIKWFILSNSRVEIHNSIIRNSDRRVIIFDDRTLDESYVVLWIPKGTKLGSKIRILDLEFEAVDEPLITTPSIRKRCLHMRAVKAIPEGYEEYNSFYEGLKGFEVAALNKGRGREHYFTSSYQLVFSNFGV